MNEYLCDNEELSPQKILDALFQMGTPPYYINRSTHVESCSFKKKILLIEGNTYVKENSNATSRAGFRHGGHSDNEIHRHT